tara:strand:+ start:1921 stop:3945 length:2025 start_codon:yes stop_codon:yes gene_type:complete
MAENQILIKFKASGDKALKEAIEQLRLSQIKLEKGHRAYQRELKKLNLEQGKQAANSLLGVKNNRLLSNSFATLRSKMLLASFAASVVAATIGKVFKAASEQEQAEIKLSSALGRTSKALLDHASAMQQVTRFGDEVTIAAMSNIAAFIKDEDAIKSLTTATMDLASAKGMDLASAADLVAKSVGSSTNALARYGIAANGAAKSTERADSVVRSISVLYGGQAKAQAESYAGTMDGMINAVGDAAEAIGDLLAPVVIAFAQALKTTSNAIESITDKLGGLSRATFNYFFGLKNLEGATVDYSDSLKDFQSSLEGLTFKELSSEIKKLEGMLPKQKKQMDANSDGLSSWSDKIKLTNTNMVAISESTGQLIEKDGKLIASTQGVANAQQTLQHITNSLNIAYRDQEERQTFAQELYGKTSESQAAATRKMIEWVKANKESFSTTQEYTAVLKMLQGQLDKTGESWEKQAEKALKNAQVLTTSFSNMNSAQSKEVETRMNQELEGVKNSVQFKKASDTRKIQMEKRVTDKYKAERERIAKFERASALAQAGINIGLAITKHIANPFMVTLIGAMGAVQLAAIANTPLPKFAKGGLIGGKRHSQGGTMIEAEQGEFVMSRNATQAIGLENLNRMNQGGGGAVNVTFTGNVMSQDFIENEAIPQIKEAIRRGADIGVS